MEYSEVQSNEVEALKAIYMEDFEEISTQSVWSKRPVPMFRIKLRPSTEFEDSPIALEVVVTLPKTYPNSLPLVEIAKSNDLHPKQLDVLRKSIKDTTESLKGSEMIFEITSEIQSQLDDYARISQAPSLEEARTERLEQLKQQEHLQMQRRIEEQERKTREAEQHLEELVLEELEEPRDSDANISYVPLVPDGKDVFTFDRPVAARRSNGTIVRFQQVSGDIITTANMFGTSYLVKPVSDSPVDEDLLLGLTKISITDVYWDSTAGRKQLQDLESELEILRDFRHPNVATLYEFKIEKLPEGWQVALLTQHCNMGTLADLLDTVGTVSIKVARKWSIQILEALEALHKTGLVHKALTAENVQLIRKRDTGESSIVLANPSYLYRFLVLDNSHPFNGECAGTKAVHLSAAASGAVCPKWIPPSAARTRKSDVWQYGVVLVQMICGKTAPQSVLDPISYIRGQSLPASLVRLFKCLFSLSGKERATPFDVLMSEFLRSDDEDDSNLQLSDWRRRGSSFSRPRSLSVNERPTLSYSRYMHDFDEGVVLGRGGFGQVVKARNKLDGRVYAVKKIHATASTLSHILQEVVLLSRLNHQNVVRYYTVWLEESIDSSKVSSVVGSRSGTPMNGSVPSSGQMSSAQASALDSSLIKYGHSLSSLDLVNLPQDHDFMSSGNFQLNYDDSLALPEPAPLSSDGFVFANSNAVSDGSDEDEDEDEDSDSRGTELIERISPPTKSTLYIQMEYCENHTLADLIHDGLYRHPQEYWRLMRQIVEALAYIHQEGIIHRDLKPKNIFIDEVHNIKIGDFGLARSVIQNMSQQHAASPALEDDLTTQVGTSLYIAVELQGRESKGSYNEKVDMYSLGVIFFEMVFAMGTGMERIDTIKQLRTAGIVMPSGFMTKKYAPERDIVHSLLQHDPIDRPSAQELLDSGMLPLGASDKTLKEAMRTLLNPDNNTKQQLINSLFDQPLVSAQQVLYDRTTSISRAPTPRAAANTSRTCTLWKMPEVLLREQFDATLRKVFEMHGAVENNTFRPKIMPRSALYKNPTVMELLDRAGNVLQLAHDLTLPHARRLAERLPDYRKCFTFATVYRSDTPYSSHHPVSCSEVDFDILSADPVLDTVFQDAECIKTMADVASAMPCFEADQISIHVNHFAILSTVLDHGGFTAAQHYGALSLLGDLGLAPAKPSVRRELVGRSTISATSLDVLEKLGFCDTLSNAEARLDKLLGGCEQIKAALAHLKAVTALARKFGVTHKILLAPLSNHRPKFYEGGIMFQLVVHTNSKRTILAAGGRYDELIRSFRHQALDSGTPLARAVGFNLAVDLLMDYLMVVPSAKLADAGWLRPRCQVLVSSFNEANIKGMCMDLVRMLWANGISADLVRAVGSSEALVKEAERDYVPFVVVVKQLHSISSRSFKPLRVKVVATKIDYDLGMDEIVSFILSESDSTSRAVPLAGHTVAHLEQQDTESAAAELPAGSSGRVVILNESGKLKGGRKNKWLIEERAREAMHSYLAELANLPIVSLDLRDDVLQAITTVSPYVQEDWRRKVIGMAPNQKGYLFTVQAKLATEALKSPRLVLFSTKTSNMFVYNTEQFPAV